MNEHYYKKILKIFSDSGIEYCILRNYGFLLPKEHPEHAPHHRNEGLNIAIAKESLPQALHILNNNGFTQRTQQFSRSHISMFKVLDGKKISFDIQIDGVHWRDIQYLNKTMFSRKRKINDICVLSLNDEYIMLITHSIGKGFYRPPYQQRIKELQILIDKQSTHKQLTAIFSEKIATTITKNIQSNIFNIPSRAKIMLMVKNPWKITKLILRWMKQKRPKLKPLISVIGPDGAGKTTLVKNLQEFLNNQNRKATIIYTGRGRGQVLPIRTIGNKYKKAEKKRDSKHKGSSTKRKILYTLAAPVFAADLFLRTIVQIYPKRFSNIVITDRYCSDILVMKHTPTIIKKIVYKIFPKPTITLYLHNTAETLHARRPEESIQELRRQLHIFQTIPHTFNITTTNQTEDTNFAITAVYTELLRTWQ